MKNNKHGTTRLKNSTAWKVKSCGKSLKTLRAATKPLATSKNLSAATGQRPTETTRLRQPSLTILSQPIKFMKDRPTVT